MYICKSIINRTNKNKSMNVVKSIRKTVLVVVLGMLAGNAMADKWLMVRQWINGLVIRLT